ncbi:DUF397 domain-containing protein [Actinomadura gamaensis]|uniref:DUF397 domain-containing protein n=1 Tax=Actinomadura gamaensis TaxID=1763541 RepID=A0ABV9U808_9ACTN
MEHDQGLNWRKPSYSDEEVNCVEVARLSRARMAIRGSKPPSEPVLTLDQKDWLSRRATLSKTR